MSTLENEIKEPSIALDKKNNRIIISIDDAKFTIPIYEVRKVLVPLASEEEQIRELQQALHEIEKENLVKMYLYIQKVKELADGIAGARVELSKCDKMLCVKKYDTIIKSYNYEKNNIVEIRRTVNILEKNKKELRAKIARLEKKLKFKSEIGDFDEGIIEEETP